MANILSWTPKKLRELRDLGGESFFVFQKAIWQDRDLYPPLHGRLCNWLQNDIQQGDSFVLSITRGGLKSSTIRAWFAWIGLYQKFWEDPSILYVGQKYENIEESHEMFQAKFSYGAQAQMLRDMFSHRLPQNLEGWTKKRTLLKQTDANAEPFLSIASIEGRQEGKHRHIILGDDLEGADADTSDAPNRESRRFVLERMLPLTVIPSKAIRGVVGTPHGKDPLVHYLRELPGWKCFWAPCVVNGETIWPERFSEEFVETMQAQAKVSREARRVWDMQYMLRKQALSSLSFDIDAIRENSWRRKFIFAMGKNHAVIEYDKQEESIDPLTGHHVVGAKKTTHVKVDHCRASMHVDPRHKDKDQTLTDIQQSKWAVTVILTAPDYHSFVVDRFISDTATTDEALKQIIYFYRKWVPWKVSFDPVGAQMWLRVMLEQYEKIHFGGRMTSLKTSWRPEVRPIPRIVSVLEEAHKQNVPKEEYIEARLQPHFANGWLHLEAGKDEEILGEIADFGSDKASLDGLDSLSQGPDLWKPYPTQQSLKERLKRELLRKMGQEGRLYVAPWKAASGL